ncbi:MAG: hypothetical protein R2822_26365 [Spirosomataceae bacterium]
MFLTKLVSLCIGYFISISAIGSCHECVVGFSDWTAAYLDEYEPRRTTT